MNCKVIVKCLSCGAGMYPYRELAHVQHIYERGSTECKLILFRCPTADCGNQVTVEDH